ncbi:aBC-2 type transporter [Clostridium sp. CAG:567]|jgi:ABC-2 type transport system permease protein|nr:aBC-2 type transporter [Clostridium sp. CAG:567]
MFAIYKKELKSYFLSPTGYITIGLFLLIFSLFFYLTTVSVGGYDIGNLYFNTARYGLLIIVPILTMRMFAEERKNGTEQLLLTSPRSITEIVLGKFFAGVSVIVITLIFSLIYYAILCFFKAPNLVPTLVMILGFLLVGMAAISIGMFISSLTENQIISAVVTIVFFVSSWFLPNLNDNFSIIDLMSNYQKFPAGLISMSEVVNLLGITVVFILFTIIIMQRKKSIK